MRKPGHLFLTVTLLLSSLFLSGCLDSDDGIDTTEQFRIDIELIDQYLAENGINAQRDDGSGIRYVVTNPGTGLALVFFADSITLSYDGRVMSTGAQFTSVTSEKSNTLAVFNNGIRGIISAITKIREGGSVTAYIPSGLGYGTREVDGVPPNSVLIMDIDFEELNHVKLKQDIQVIDNVLAERNITPAEHPSGIRFVVNDIGTGGSPNFSTSPSFRVNYEGRIFGETVAFDDGTNSPFSLTQDLIIGWQVMIPEMKIGESRTIYLPSPYGYGVNGTRDGVIPPNTILEFDIELISAN